MAKIYIAGKISGLGRIQVSHKFGRYEKELTRAGHEPVNPLNLVEHGDNWDVCMRKCITALMACDEIHLLPCYKDSKGAMIEFKLAKKLNMPVTLLPSKNW